MSPDQTNVLRAYSITTLEELFAALRSRRAGVATALSLSDHELDDLEVRVAGELPRDVLARLAGPHPVRERGFGARVEPYRAR